MAAPIRIAYTFGNHMHWVDMQWLWGYDVLPGSIDDMLKFCSETGAKGNVNFDGIGYEKLAAESPESLAKLRRAVQVGTVEVVGSSYGQPYGHFHGGESNIRQRVYGIRAAMRTLGTRPRTFWEEEFDCFHQLPQILDGCGFTGASLYFQWTWHTPEVPWEDAPVVNWVGHDGTKLPTATRNRMNLHQWPEDFRLLLDDLEKNPPSGETGVPPLILQWLELMPSKDWMCRAELMAPMLKELKADPRFEIEMSTLGEYLAQWSGKELPERKYSPDDFWHGMTLGKNGDRHIRRSLELEHRLLEAETAAAILGLFGRPYVPWDVYPTWEFEECWRQLLAAQHHDNHECEGLCGHVAEAQFAFVESLLEKSDAVQRLANRVEIGSNEQLVFNRLSREVPRVGSVGYSIVGPTDPPCAEWKIEDGIASFETPEFRIRIDIADRTILSLQIGEAIVEVVHFGVEAGAFHHNPDLQVFRVWQNSLNLNFDDGFFLFEADPENGWLRIQVNIGGGTDGTPIRPGYQGAIRMGWGFPDIQEIHADSPYAVSPIKTGSRGKRKYPEGDWMTSPQWFEEVEGAFTAQSFVDVRQRDCSVLITHSGSQQWFRTEEGLSNVILSNDPWDGFHQSHEVCAEYFVIPHNGLSHAECVSRGQWHRVAGEFGIGTLRSETLRQPQEHPLPTDFSAVQVKNPNVLATAFFREQASYSRYGLDAYAGQGIEHPYVLRLVEYDGVGGDVEIVIAGPIAQAIKANMMGEPISPIQVIDSADRPITSQPERLEPFGICAQTLKLQMRPYEIATIYLDIVPGRKQFRDLDAKREIWATVHRTEE